MDLTNEELKATRMLRDEYDPVLTPDELELIKIYRKLTKVEQCIVIRDMKAREYLNNE